MIIKATPLTLHQQVGAVGCLTARGALLLPACPVACCWLPEQRQKPPRIGTNADAQWRRVIQQHLGSLRPPGQGVLDTYQNGIGAAQFTASGGSER